MNNHLKPRYAFISLTLSVLLASSAIADTPPELSFETTEVGEGLYMLSGSSGFTGGNIGITVGEDGVAVIDNGLPSVLELLQSEIKKLTGQPIDYLINTHVHGDHIGNNEVFGEGGTRIISHENLRKGLVEKGIYTGQGYDPAPKAAVPVLTFSDRMTIHINGDAAKLIHTPKAHTDGDSVIHFQNANVIHTGDVMFNGRFPFIDYSNGGSLDGAIAGLKVIEAAANDDTKVIPGHGPLASRDDVTKTIAMLEDARTLVGDLIAAGKTNEEILAANPLAKYSDYNWGFITTERMTNQVIEGIRGASQ